MCASTHSTVASRLSSTCASQQRAPLSILSTVSDQSATSFHLSLTSPPLSLSHKYSDVRFSTRPLSPSTLSLSQVLRPAFSFSHCAPPSSGRVATVSANREHTPPLPPAFPRFGNRQRRMSICWGDPRGRFGGKSRRASEKQADDEPSQRRSARAFWQENSPRRRRVSIRPAGRVTTRCSFDGECR